MLREEYLTCLTLHKKLKERIKGRIFITIQENTLIVNINAGRGIKRHYRFKCDIKEVDEIYVGDTAYRIERDYRKFINNRFLYN